MCLGRQGAVWGSQGEWSSQASVHLLLTVQLGQMTMLTVHGSVILDICTHLIPENLTICALAPHQKKKNGGEFPHSSFQSIYTFLFPWYRPLVQEI